jgi:hypothetical protein
MQRTCRRTHSLRQARNDHDLALRGRRSLAWHQCRRLARALCFEHDPPPFALKLASHVLFRVAGLAEIRASGVCVARPNRVIRQPRAKSARKLLCCWRTYALRGVRPQAARFAGFARRLLLIDLKKIKASIAFPFAAPGPMRIGQQRVSAWDAFRRRKAFRVCAAAMTWHHPGTVLTQGRALDTKRPRVCRDLREAVAAPQIARGK